MKKLKNIRFLAAMILVLLLSASYSSKENTVTKVYAKKVKKALKQLLYIYIESENKVIKHTNIYVQLPNMKSKEEAKSSQIQTEKI